METAIPLLNMIYYRLIALWVLCEAMLGGIIHGLKIPVSGLVVGSCAIICICLIGWYVPKKGSILKATLIVAIFKMMLSPQASFPAYFAVFFQGAMGEFLFRNRNHYRLSCMLLGVLGLLESGLQRILVLTIVYGNDFWRVINDFINGLTKQKVSSNYSLWIASGYVAIHFVTGAVVGWWASVLPRRVATWQKKNNFSISAEVAGTVSLPVNAKKRTRLKKGLFLVWIILVALYIQSYFKIGTPLLPPNLALKILLRSLIIVLSWIFIFGPLLKQAIHLWLKKKQARAQTDIQQVFQLLPATQRLMAESWKLSSDKKGWNRLKKFSRVVLVNALNMTVEMPVYILSAPKRSGKTTALVDWTAKRNDIMGILTPDIEGKRVFMNAATREQFPMEASGDEATISIGKFNFSIMNFDKAIHIIRQGISFDGWLVIDEIGPLELKGEGFAGVLNEILSKRKAPLLLVVREEMLEILKQQFPLGHAIVISDPTALP